MSDPLLWPVILSGGVGSRLWPLSRAASPKQLLPLVAPETMIQATALRAADTRRFHAPIVVAGDAHEAAILAQLGAVDRTPAALLLEPEGRNTAPAIALAAHWLAARGEGDGLMLVMPSDHVIVDTAAFMRAVEAARAPAAEGWLVTFGIHARTPETGYGYIHLGEALGNGVRRVEAFVEKPALETAQAYVRGGHHAWNGGIFLMRADRFLEELEQHAPAISQATRAALAEASTDGPTVRPEPTHFAASPSDSIDYAVMEKAARVAVVPIDMGWSDVGSWDALYEIAETDEHGNAARGEAIMIDSHDCLIRSEGPLVAAVGLKNVTIVATPDAVLVVQRGHAQDVKKVVDRLKARRSALL